MIKKCEYCGKEFEQSKRRKRFCCIECYRKFKSVNKIGSEIKYKFLGTTTKNSKIYNIWCGILRRCYNKNQRSFNNYGLRGITVCDNWKDFKNFYDWAIANGYKDGLSIERINVNGNYCPENCTWITMKEQAKNKTNNIWVEYNGKSLILKDVANLENVNYKDLWRMYKIKNDIKEALKICYIHKQKRGSRT
jgi:hypothetical protein